MERCNRSAIGLARSGGKTRSAWQLAALLDHPSTPAAFALNSSLLRGRRLDCAYICMARVTAAVILLVTGVVLVLVMHVLVVVWAIRRGAVLRLRDEKRGEAAGLTAEELGELPCQDFEADADGAGGECAVCLEAFQAGDRCRVLPRCQHGFHALCVDSWLSKCRRCPVCRTEVAGSGKTACLVTDGAATAVALAERVGAADRY